MQQPAHILVVEDETEIRELIALHLGREGHQVMEADSAEKAMELVSAHRFDLLVLDWMLPGRNGLDLMRLIRQNVNLRATPILMVTARAGSHDIVAGLEAGADDYLTKPFDPPILLARVRALLRRKTLLETPSDQQAIVQLGDLTVNTDTYEVSCGGSAIQLTPSEFKLLVALAASRGKVLTRDSLIEHVQGEGVSVVGRTVDTHVFGLRKKLGACSEVIETVRGVGYRIR